MDSEDDFLPATQFSTQYRSMNRQAVTSTSRPVARDMLGPSRSAAWDAPGTSRSGGQGASQASQELSQIQDGLKFLMERVQQLSGDSRGIKRPAEQKPYDKKPDTKEQCHLCKKLYANKTTLFRHYRAMHQEMNPEKYHGCSVNSTVVSLDMSFRENTCGVCEYAAASQTALDAHNRAVHSNVVNVNSNNDANISTSNSNASVNSNNRTDGIVAGGKKNVSYNNVIDKLHKCEQCACYFEERNKLDEHMKVQHGYEVVCKICNKNLLFKDIDGHVKESHPDVYKKNKEKTEKVIIEKVMKNKKGNRVNVFICTKCHLKMIDKIEAERHARGHKKGLKIKVAPRNKVSKAKNDFTDVASNNVHIILTCDDCDTSTESYDVAVEHAQYHITNNSNDIQLVTQLCLICELKFEPLCYKKHIDLHYNNKEIHKESFKYFKYRFQLLLSDNWFDCFNTDEPVFKEMISRSIYEHTRSVTMRVMHEGVYKLYKCCQCDHFVEPTSVLNHTINYDTCVKVKCSYACNICQRKFNNRLARNNHAKDHKSEENYKIVLFNHVNDKELNKILNDPNRSINNGELRNSVEVLDNNSANDPKVLYKCLCGLCFVRKENVDVHAKICPGRDPKKSCPKCNNFFNPEELLTHCFEHHLNETRIVIENICPNAVVVDSDEESENKVDDNHDIIEIDSSDEDGVQTERFDNIKIEVLKADEATIGRGSSGDVTERQTMNSTVIAVSEAGENIEHVSSEPTLIIEKSEKDNIDEDEDRCNNDLGIDNEMTDDDSQDTISYENTETVTDVAISAPNMNEHDKLKCVPMNLLLNPLHFENGFLNKGNIDVLNAEISTDIETVRQQLNRTANEMSCGPLNDTASKQEKPWLFDPTDFSNIRSRRSLRQIEMEPVSSNLKDIVELLTDDEETEMNYDNEYAEINDNIRSDENNDILNKETENDVREETSNNISNTLTTEQTPNGDTLVDILNDIPHTTNNVEDIQIQHTLIIQNEANDIEESVAETNAVCENAQTELTNVNGQGVNTNISNSSHLSHEDAENNEITTQDFSDDDDDLFIPSGIGNHNTELNNNEKEMPKDNPLNYVERIVAQVDSANNTHSNDRIEESESVCFENISVDISTCGENLQQDTEIGIDRSHENNDIVNIDRNQRQIDRENYEPTEHVQSTQDFVECTPNETPTNSIFTDIAERGTTLKELPKKQTDTTIEKEFGYMNINIKRELIEENVQENVNGCDREVVRIKTEPNDVESEYNDNKENDIFIINKTDSVNYKNCSIC